MAEIGETIEISEGDLVLTFNKTIDLMRQVRDMLLGVRPDHPLRHGLQAAERLLRRGIVEQSLTLGFAPADDPPPDEPDASETGDVAPGLETPPERPRRRKKTKGDEQAGEAGAAVPALVTGLEGEPIEAAGAKPKRSRRKTATETNGNKVSASATPASLPGVPGAPTADGQAAPDSTLPKTNGRRRKTLVSQALVESATDQPEPSAEVTPTTLEGAELDSQSPKPPRRRRKVEATVTPSSAAENEEARPITT